MSEETLVKIMQHPLPVFTKGEVLMHLFRNLRCTATLKVVDLEPEMQELLLRSFNRVAEASARLNVEPRDVRLESALRPQRSAAIKFYTKQMRADERSRMFDGVNRRLPTVVQKYLLPDDLTLQLPVSSRILELAFLQGRICFYVQTLADTNRRLEKREFCVVAIGSDDTLPEEGRLKFIGIAKPANPNPQVEYAVYEKLETN